VNFLSFHNNEAYFQEMTYYYALFAIAVHLKVSFQTNTEHIINKYNHQLEKGTNIKQ
jgi:hypothetical protein